MNRGTRLLLAGLTWAALLGGAQAAAAATPGVAYNGGPVAHSMTGVVVDWGDDVNPVYTNETTGDPGLIKYLAANTGSTGDIGGVLAQYMDSTGANAANVVSYGQQYAITPSVTSTTITDSQIRSELAKQIQAGHLPRPAGNGLQTIYLVLFPKGDTECAFGVCDGQAGGFCAYHGNTSLSGTNVLYAVLPDNTSGGMAQGCGQASSWFADQTSYLSHEWSETITDPLGTAWWDSSNGGTGNEVGDWCNQEMTQQGGWTVQLEWSNLDANCAGAESAFSSPTASFVAPGAASPAQQISFDASSSSDPSGNQTSISDTSYSIGSGLTSYQWDWGDGSSSTATATPVTTHAYAAVGNYNVSLTVTDKLGFTSTVTKQVAIDSTLPPAATTDPASGVSVDGATLNGTVNPGGQAVQYQFAYGTAASSLDQTTPLTTGPTGTTATPVSAALSGLLPATTYYYQLNVVAGGQTYPGSVQTFTTDAAPPPAPTQTPTPPQTPTVVTGTAAQITTSSALLAGTINPGGSQAVTYHFAYGPSAADLSSTTPETSGSSGTTAVPVTATAGGLKARSTYYYELVASLGGQTYTGSVSSFTTLTPAPGATTGAATKVTSTGATVLGTVNPNGAPATYLVEFGASTAYGHSTTALQAGSGTAGVPVTVALTGLAARTSYHYRVVAIGAGGTAVGSDRTFTTAKALARAPRFTFRINSPAAIRAAQRGQLKVRFSCDKGCTARFSVTVASAGLRRFTPVPVTLAHGSGRIRSKGSGSAAITFIPTIRNGLRRYRSAKLVISGYAISAGSAPSAPKQARFTLT